MKTNEESTENAGVTDSESKPSEQPTNAEVRAALRRTTLARTVLPVMAGAALRGKGVEPLLDSIADLLPSPLDRLPPALTNLDASMWTDGKKSRKKTV